MSVTTSVQLPDQPAAGFTRIASLGGNGWQSPRSMTVVQVQLAGDASGGTNIITANLDPVYLNLVAAVQFSIAGAAADVDMRGVITGPEGEFMQISTTIPYHNAGGGTLLSSRMWTPTPVMLVNNDDPGDYRIQMITPNTNGDTNYLELWLCNFEKRAAEVTPLEILTASLPRGGAIS